MQTNHASALRGMSIAVTIIAGLTILGCIIGIVFMGVLGSYLGNITPSMWDQYLNDGGHYSHRYDDVDGIEMAIAMDLLVGYCVVVLLVIGLLTIVSLIPGIIGLRNKQNPKKLTMLFGWSLAGAITAFLTGNIPNMVLLIIMCVFAYKDKGLAAAQPIIVTQPVMTAQPVQPVQPIAQPMQSAQPVAQPAAPVPPTSPAAPAAPAAAADSAASETVVIEETVTPTEVAEEIMATEETKAE